VGTVPVIIQRISGVGDGIHSVHIIYKAVAVIIPSVRGDLSRIAPRIRGEIGVIVVDTGIDNGDYHRVRPGRGVPRLG
jgi:hypothetical protein